VGGLTQTDGEYTDGNHRKSHGNDTGRLGHFGDFMGVIHVTRSSQGVVRRVSSVKAVWLGKGSYIPMQKWDRV
jgi:hypothetical protein